MFSVTWHLLNSWILICSFHMILHCLTTYSASVHLKEAVKLHFLSFLQELSPFQVAKLCTKTTVYFWLPHFPREHLAWKPIANMIRVRKVSFQQSSSWLYSQVSAQRERKIYLAVPPVTISHSSGGMVSLPWMVLVTWDSDDRILTTLELVQALGFRTGALWCQRN